jgi:molybdopterin molybdotransferase
MIPFEEAYELVLGAAVPLAAEPIPLAEAAGRILAEEITADGDLPPFDKSAMDGYACRRADLPRPLRQIETIAAGILPVHTIRPGECARIMTGAPVPAGADCVIMQEHVRIAADGTILFTGRTTADNICRRGEDVVRGSRVLCAGERITPAHLAVLSACGITTPRVARQPRVAIAATGSELVAAAEPPSGARIRDSNTPQLCAQVRDAGGRPTPLGIIPDNQPALADAIRAALPHHDLLLFSGGASAGDFDFVPATLRQLGFTLLFETVAMQPGKPTVFGRHPCGVCCCGMPGNPVSTFVVFELLVKPFLLKQMGHTCHPRRIRVRLDTEFRRRKAERQLTLPVRFTSPETVTLVDYHGSAHIHALCAAEALLTVPAGVETLIPGAPVDVRLL